MSLFRILLIDDDPELLRGIRSALMDDVYDVITANNGMDGLHAAQQSQPDLVVLDINMPWMDGLQVCQRLRQDSQLRHVPILLLTARHSIDDRVSGLDKGADDFLSKPFHTRELKARIRALLRRTQLAPNGDGTTLEYGGLTLDLQACQVQVAGETAVQLTPTEFDLLYYLMTHPGQPFSSQELLQNVWKYEEGTADPSLARWHIRNLRAKIEPDPHHPIYIRTVPRHGYMLPKAHVTLTQAPH